MGVFARLLGKKPKVTEEPDTEAPAAAEPEGLTENPVREAAGASVTKDSAKESVEESVKQSGEDAADGADGAGGVAARTDPGTVAATGPDSTEIPQQQSAKEAADNEVGQGART
ncbi:hypothetical protein [Streptomyces sp. NPDC001068]|uniref:hypothetical protein n=1 Tax=Streptomyces sp. NPDC001068 TaxID=3364544 RepID=UPI0036BC9078